MARLVCSSCRYLLDTAGLGEEESAELHDSEGLLVCPSCGEADTFFRVEEEGQASLDPDDPSEIEEMHTPYCRIEDDAVIVRVGSEDDPHPMDEDHYLVSIGLYTHEGEPVEVREDVDPGAEMSFSLADVDPDDVEIRLVCNRHGVWKGVAERSRKDAE